MQNQNIYYQDLILGKVLRTLVVTPVVKGGFQTFMKNIGKLGVVLSLETNKKENEILDFGKNLSMHIAASSPLSIDKEDLDQKILQKEKDIITEELKNSGKDPKIVEKIAMGKLNKYIEESTLLNQEWIMEPKKKVKEILSQTAGKDKIKIKKFVRFKVGEGL